MIDDPSELNMIEHSYYQALKEKRMDDSDPINDERIHETRRERRKEYLSAAQVEEMGRLLSEHNIICNYFDYIKQFPNSVSYLTLAGATGNIKVFGADLNDFLLGRKHLITLRLDKLGVDLAAPQKADLPATPL